MRIHREGRLILFITLVLMTGIVLAGRYLLHLPHGLLDFIIVATAFIYFFILQFFRDPRITVVENNRLALAPADGKVVVIEETGEGEYLKERRIQISIFMSPVNVHVNRSPVSGKVSYFKYHPGKYLVAWHPKSSTENERTSLVIETPGGLKLMVRQIAGIVARRIKYYVKEGDVLKQGQEFGFIKFGSRVDIFLPVTAKILVKPGQKVTAGITPLAEV
jgi:phosphatidylserine decarboxylase